VVTDQQRILVIDDEESVCRLLETVLVSSGYAVAAYTRPQQAVATFAAEHYDLVITDIKMPVMDGLQVLQHTKENNANTPVILITGVLTDQIADQAIRQGAYAILAKPFKPRDLISTVHDALRQTGSGQESRPSCQA